MPQNLIFLTLTEADHAAIADALSTLESKLTGLISLSAEVDVDEAQRDMAQIDALRPHIAR